MNDAPDFLDPFVILLDDVVDVDFREGVGGAPPTVAWRLACDPGWTRSVTVHGLTPAVRQVLSVVASVAVLNRADGAARRRHGVRIVGGPDGVATS